MIIPDIKNPFETEKSDEADKKKVKQPKFLKHVEKAVKPVEKALKPVGDAISSGANAIGKVGDQIAAKSEEIFRNKDLMKRQMLFYGVVRLYNDYLEQFVNQ